MLWDLVNSRPLTQLAAVQARLASSCGRFPTGRNCQGPFEMRHDWDTVMDWNHRKHHFRGAHDNGGGGEGGTGDGGEGGCCTD